MCIQPISCALVPACISAFFGPACSSVVPEVNKDRAALLLPALLCCVCFALCACLLEVLLPLLLLQLLLLKLVPPVAADPDGC
jgi:hypothetical protein